jgi:streptomycin 6-kinase
MRVPRALAETWGHEQEWLELLPDLVAGCAEQWSLALEEPIETPHSLVVPAGDVVLKLNAPNDEAATEADALERWAGLGAVRLVARDDRRHALLVERCRPGTRLWDTREDQARVVGDLLERLRVGAGSRHPFALLADEADRWAEDVPRWYAEGGAPFERRLLDAALDVYRTVDRRAEHLVNQDLHGGNILRAQREPWLVIDPKPLAGERELDASGLLRNTDDVTRWLDVLADAGHDRERARGWGIAHNLAWAWDECRGWLGQHVDEARRVLTAR